MCLSTVIICDSISNCPGHQAKLYISISLYHSHAWAHMLTAYGLRYELVMTWQSSEEQKKNIYPWYPTITSKLMERLERIKQQYCTSALQSTVPIPLTDHRFGIFLLTINILETMQHRINLFTDLFTRFSFVPQLRQKKTSRPFLPFGHPAVLSELMIEKSKGIPWPGVMQKGLRLYTKLWVHPGAGWTHLDVPGVSATKGHEASAVGTPTFTFQS